MIMKRLTPEQAFQAFKENREIYTLQQVDPSITVMELIQRDDLVMFEETPQEPKSEPTVHEEVKAAEEPKPGRTKATEAQSEPVAKESKGVRADHDTIMEMWRQGWTVKQIREVVGCSDQTVRNHIARG